MKHIGLVAGAQRSRAIEIKAALLAADSNLEVTVDTEDFATLDHAAFDVVARRRLRSVELYDALLRLQAAGVQVVGFSCGAAHDCLTELQAQFQATLLDPLDAMGEIKDVKRYAAEMLAADVTPRAQPFKVGMIAGLGPAASVDLYDKIVRATPAKNDQEHFKLVIEQNPQTPDRTAALLEGSTDPTVALYASAKRLEADGCDAIIIPCNTAHVFIPYMQSHVGVAFVNMQQAAMDEIYSKFGERARIGLLATSGTVRTGIYAEKAKAMGLLLFTSEAADQVRVMNAIYGPYGAKAGFTAGVCREDLVAAADALVREHDCNVLILGCTELPLILDEGDMTFACGKTAFVLDPTSALARLVVKMAQESFEKTGVR